MLLTLFFLSKVINYQVKTEYKNWVYEQILWDEQQLWEKPCFQ